MSQMCHDLLVQFLLHFVLFCLYINFTNSAKLKKLLCNI